MDLRDALDIQPTPEAVAARAAALVTDAARSAIAARGRFLLALTGGSSPLGLYDTLAREAPRGAIDWARVHVFFGDERAVPPDAPESNYRSAREHLLSRVPVPPAQVRRMEGERKDLEGAAADYERALRAVAGDDGALDLILVGLGPDAHILSLHPGCAQITHPTGLVAALRHVPMNPPIDRITFTPRVLDSARGALALAHGAGKAAALRAALDPSADPSRVPARLLTRVPGALHVVVDRAAAG